MTQNPNWPLVDEAISWQTGPSSSWPPKFWVSTAQRVRDSVSITRGRQYELDQVQTGEYHCTWDNRDGALDPTNTSSPFYPNVVPYRAFRRRHQWPPTQNILTVDQATGGSTQTAGSAHVDSLVPGWTSYTYWWTVTAEADAYTGSNVFQQVVSAAQAAPWAAADINGWSVQPGAWHSGQLQMRATAGGTSPQVYLILLWRDINGNTLSSVSGSTVTLTANSRSWQRLTVSGQAPANAVGATLQIAMANSVAVTWECSGAQVEYAQAPTAWTKPGNWYSLFTGWVERWPQEYTDAGTYNVVQPVIVDSFGYLSQSKLKAAFYNDILALSPDFFFPLDDGTGSTAFKDLTGKHSPAKVVNSPAGPGTVKPGQSISNTNPTQTLGMPGPVVTMSNPDTGPSGTYESCSWIDLTTSGISGPPASGGWTRMIAFKNSGAGPVAGTLWVSSPAKYQGSSSTFFISFGSGTSYGIAVEVVGQNAASIYSPALGTYADGNWHLIFVVVQPSGREVDIYVDGVFAFQDTSPTSDVHPLHCKTDMIGAYAYPGDGQFYNGYNGDTALCAQFSQALTIQQIQALSATWQTVWQNESSDARYSRILTYAGYQGPKALSVGATGDMGPATDLTGTDTSVALQNVVTTENGFHFVRADGTVHFEARSDRYNQQKPAFTFGEKTANGEWPYEKLGFDNDPTRVANDIQITNYSTNQVMVAQDTQGSAAQYGSRTFQRTINVTNPQECQDAANYLYNRYAQPSPRVKTISLHPSALPALWPIAMQCELSTRVRAMRRPPWGVIQFDGFIEKVTWTLDKDLEAKLDLEISPADLNTYWVYAALHTTLFSQATSGQATAVCSPLPDSATNPFKASFCSGLRLTLEPGTARAETLTVSSVSATSPGYTSCTVTFTTNLAFTHPVGSMICEALPTGVTDPTTWDPASILGTTTVLAY